MRCGKALFLSSGSLPSRLECLPAAPIHGRGANHMIEHTGRWRFPHDIISARRCDLLPQFEGYGCRKNDHARVTGSRRKPAHGGAPVRGGVLIVQRNGNLFAAQLRYSFFQISKFDQPGRFDNAQGSRIAHKQHPLRNRALPAAAAQPFREAACELMKWSLHAHPCNSTVRQTGLSGLWRQAGIYLPGEVVCAAPAIPFRRVPSYPHEGMGFYGRPPYSGIGRRKERPKEKDIMSLKLHAALLTAGLMSLAYLAAPAVADEWDKMTTFQFNQPVEVPGQVLMPGTYMFRLADLQADRDVVQIFRQDQRGMDHIITTVMAIPAYRTTTPDRTILTFEERRSDAPEAVNKWFYPGDNYGVEFVYPKAERLESASNVTATPAPAPAPAPVASAPAPAVTQAAPPPPAPAVVEEEQSTVIAQNQPPATPSVTEPSANRELPTELPKTASELPLDLTLGLFMLVTGIGILGLTRLRHNA
jgi:hypothetical protein